MTGRVCGVIFAVGYAMLVVAALVGIATVPAAELGLPSKLALSGLVLMLATTIVATVVSDA